MLRLCQLLCYQRGEATYDPTLAACLSGMRSCRVHARQWPPLRTKEDDAKGHRQHPGSQGKDVPEQVRGGAQVAQQRLGGAGSGQRSWTWCCRAWMHLLT